MSGSWNPEVEIPEGVGHSQWHPEKWAKST